MVSKSNYLNKFINFSLGGLFLFPVFSQKIRAIFVMLFALTTLILFIKTKNKNFNKLDLFILFLFVFIPLIYLFEIPFSGNVQEVSKIAEKKLPLLFIPLGFFFLKSSKFKVNIDRFLLIFYTITIGLVLYTLFYITFIGLHTKYLASGGYAFTLRTTIEEITGLHPTYYSMYIVTSILIVFYRINKKYDTFWQKALLLLSTILSAILLFMLASRMAILVFILCVLYFIWNVIPSLKIKLIGTTSILIIALTVFSTIPSLKSRTGELFENKENSTNIRSVIWGCSVETAKNNWILGTGIENAQKELNACYEGKNKIINEGNIVYNSHNEYLNILLSKGIISFILFITLLTVLFLFAKKNYLFTSIMLLIAISCLTENILERQIGILFFTLFACIITYNRLENLQIERT